MAETRRSAASGNQAGSKPVPDPTVLTTDAVNAAVAQARDYTDLRLAALEERLAGMDKAIEIAEREREKAALALREELARQIQDGDRSLGNHIEAQIAQIAAALQSAELLEKERIERAQDHVAAERRVAELTRDMSDTAILKAEVSGQKQFDEFKRAVSQQLTDMRAQVEALQRRLDQKL